MKKILFVVTTALLLAPTLASARTHSSTPAATSATAATATTAAAPAKMVSVNTASATDLMTIPGVNTKIAADIIKNRPYKNAAELVKKVKGIGNKNIKKMQPFINFM